MKMIYLDDEQKLRIYSLPLRQRILREMEKAGRPITAKAIADRLGITPSAAQHHIKKLESIGLVEQDHIESINGIQARLLRVADATVSIGQQLADETSPARDAFVEGQVTQACRDYQRIVDYARKNNLPQADTGNDLCTDIVHLTDAEAVELRAMLLEYARQHKQAREGTKPWQLVYLAYDMTLAESAGE